MFSTALSTEIPSGIAKKGEGEAKLLDIIALLFSGVHLFRHGIPRRSFVGNPVNRGNKREPFDSGGGGGRVRLVRLPLDPVPRLRLVAQVLLAEPTLEVALLALDHAALDH